MLMKEKRAYQKSGQNNAPVDLYSVVSNKNVGS